MTKTIDLSVIDRMFAAILAANENDATIDALRPQVEVAVKDHPDSETIKYGFTVAIMA